MAAISLRHVFIDLDDTLWDFKRNSYGALKIAYDKFSLAGYYPSFDDFYRIYSEKNAELWNLYHHSRISREELIVERFRYPLQRIGVYDEKIIPKLNQTYLSALSEQIGLNFYARELLQYLSLRYTLTVLSNGFREVQYRKLDNAGLRSFFDHIVLSDDVGFLKPHSGIFRHALALLSATPDSVVMIGDNYEADICGAARVGIKQIYFNPGNKPLLQTCTSEVPVNRAYVGRTSPNYPVACPTYQVSSLKEIVDIL